jgi:hypothetical protein
MNTKYVIFHIARNYYLSSFGVIYTAAITFDQYDNIITF